MADVIEITIPNGITYSLKDATAVKFVEQSLTAAQKAQARENIGAETKVEKLTLSKICGTVPGSTAGTTSFCVGLKDLLATDSTTVINFKTSPSWSLSNKDRIIRFGDFIGTRADSTAATVTIEPIKGLTSVMPTTGEWIRVKDCYNMFYKCIGVTSLNLSMFDTSEVKNMDYMFYNCDSLTTLDISSFDMSNVTRYTGFLGMSLAPSAVVLSTLKTPKINPHSDIPLPCTLYAQDGTSYGMLPITTGTSIELRKSWA